MKEFIKNPEWVDAEYESIRDIMKNRGTGANQLPSKAVAFLPADRADRVLELDQRIQAIREKSPLIVTAAIVLAFLIGLAL